VCRTDQGERPAHERFGGDVQDVLARLYTDGAELVGELVQYQGSFRPCYIRGPEGIIVALAEPLS
jgi:hypothetical protein